MDLKILNEEIRNIEIKYNKKLEEENNYDKIMVLLCELNFLRNQNIKKCKYTALSRAKRAEQIIIRTDKENIKNLMRK